jgi:hypothetical protein
VPGAFCIVAFAAASAMLAFVATALIVPEVFPCPE